ncbi:MAG TPA: hypothetical protein VK611_13980 [Acidimicrobiales bacterium]|nr:hypothetical protein [Acidimicrobiales bacterium]
MTPSPTTATLRVTLPRPLQQLHHPEYVSPPVKVLPVECLPTHRQHGRRVSNLPIGPPIAAHSNLANTVSSAVAT